MHFRISFLNFNFDKNPLDRDINISGGEVSVFSSEKVGKTTPQAPAYNTETSGNGPGDRSKYLEKDRIIRHEVKKGDTPYKIAAAYGVDVSSILKANGLSEETASNLQIGQVLKIPIRFKLKDDATFSNLNDVAEATGLSVDFIERLKAIEDGSKCDSDPDCEDGLHVKVYEDSNGVETIGIGHRWLPGEPRELTPDGVRRQFVSDILKCEEQLINLFDDGVYENMPQAIKEALIDMAFNKGIKTIAEDKDLMYRLKKGKYEAAINKMTYIKANETNSNEADKEMSGLCKRRIFDISRALKFYDGPIPQSNVGTIMLLYEKGVELLRKECSKKGYDFNNMISGFDDDISSYFDGNPPIKLLTK